MRRIVILASILFCCPAVAQTNRTGGLSDRDHTYSSESNADRYTNGRDESPSSSNLARRKPHRPVEAYPLYSNSETANRSTYDNLSSGRVRPAQYRDEDSLRSTTRMAEDTTSQPSSGSPNFLPANRLDTSTASPPYRPAPAYTAQPTMDPPPGWNDDRTSGDRSTVTDDNLYRGSTYPAENTQAPYGDTNSSERTLQRSTTELNTNTAPARNSYPSFGNPAADSTNATRDIGTGSGPNTDPRYTLPKTDDAPTWDANTIVRPTTTSMTMLLLFGSIGLNLYLFWIAWDTYNRYQDLVAEMRSSRARRDRTEAEYGERSAAEY